MHPPAPLLHLQNVGVRMGSAPELLSDVELMLRAGEVAVVAGRRGSGKTLLARVAAADRHPDRGRAWMLGQEPRTATAQASGQLRRQIGWCRDAPALLPGLRPVEQVALPLRLAGIAAAEATADAAELLEWCGGGADPLRIGVARALVARPPLVVLDEPLRDGGGVPVERLATLVTELRRSGTAFLVTVDHLDRGAPLAPDRRFVLVGGRLAAA